MKEEFKPPYYKLIKIDGYRYAIAKEEAKNGEWAYFAHDNRVAKVYLYTDKKVIATNNPTLSDLLWLPEPDGQEDIEALAEEQFPFMDDSNDKTGEIEENNMQMAILRRVYVRAYKAAKGKGTYSEDDMKKAYQFGTLVEAMATTKTWDDFIKSLKPEPIGVELEMESGISIFRRTGDVEISQPKVGMENGKDSVIVKRFIYAE